MRKLFACLTVIFLSSIFAFSQTETPKEPEWKAFAPENEEFSIEAPVSLEVPKPIIPAGLEGLAPPENETRRYTNTLNGTYFYIFSDYWKTPKQYKIVLKFAYDSNQLETTQKSGELTTTKFEFFDGMDFYHTILAVNGKNRVYVFHTVSPKKDDSVVERFFSSIKFNQKSLAEASSDAKTKGNITVTIPTTEPDETAEIKVKTPSGGIGSGNQTSQENKPSTPPTGVTAGVTILSKPRANYTDYARFYEMQGKVVLRVTFSANGSIGAIKPISKLPFGLTEEAIAAARGIRFEPAMRAGVSYSVTKPVEYIFTIY